MAARRPASRKPGFSRQRLILNLIVVGVLLALWLFNAYRSGDSVAEEEAPPVSGVTTPDQSCKVLPDSTLRFTTWNIANLGRSKSDAELADITQVLRDCDLVAVQEVSTSEAGAQAVARLDDLLDRTGAQWDYTLSDPTAGEGRERYAFLWKASRVQRIGDGWLEPTLAPALDREPFLARFAFRGRRLLVANFHAVPADKDPASEIRHLDRLHDYYASEHLLVVGDFNLAQHAEAFDDLKAQGYAPVLADQRTTLRMKVAEDGHLANAYDNIFFEPSALRIHQAGVVDFTGQYPSLEAARDISDHLPVYAAIGWR
jgi:endonuclease/exonuclease/phosphatase family metal-dependent hydrolase